MAKKSPFLESIRQTMRLRGYALKTKKAICIGFDLTSAFTTNATLRRWGKTKLLLF